MVELVDDVQRQFDVGNILFSICSDLEITKTQQERAETSYHAVGKWLADGQHPYLKDAEIYPQGSIRLKTTVKPIGNDEFDVDLVCHLPHVPASIPAMEVYRIVGERLAEKETYKKILKSKNRCWKLNYSGNFHLDITPAITDEEEHHTDSIEVPDKEKSCWKDSNPKGYADWFGEYAKFKPKLSIKTVRLIEAKAQIEELPDVSEPTKDWLRKIVQICKRQRDVYYLELPEERKKRAPISIIITTLAAKAYKVVCLSNKEFNSFQDVFEAVIKEMPKHIHIKKVNGEPEFTIPNETTKDENFAEKWNQDNERALEFNRWQQSLLKSLQNIDKEMPVYQLKESLDSIFGDTPVKRYFDADIKNVNQSRNSNTLKISAAVGVGASSGNAVPKNQFYMDGKG
ncbi:cyclic GMP-AMP synthase DncV-like nucleotidyltransferase [Pleionea sp. CnH1-48]|uniref:SMODS domain-containing nucleotidyltransferase n=1 Tax=Pleionea sp. CnH1-48 TaxID=2954494 RepID=UPI0020970801|nr:hypothetical protein [Pleionea sp. CnH1-48]MCO7227560.1 hypothetical protein [Pleionea sp. CnH1-48]